jgi:hypothetical protein
MRRGYAVAVDPSAAKTCQARVLADGWYSWMLPNLRPLYAVVESWPPRLQRLVTRSGLARALVLLVCARRYAAIAKIRGSVGWRTLLLLSALARSRKIVALHFIEQPPRTEGVGALVDRAWAPLDRWATRHAVISAQVLTPWETELYARRFGLDRAAFRFIPFAWRRAPRETPFASRRPSNQRTGVIAAGRNACDWPTLFAAAAGTDWPLTVVCQASDRPLVDQLNHGGRASVFSELRTEEVQEMLEQAAVAVIAVRDEGISQAQIRLCAAVDAATPIVASRIRSLEGYLEEGRTSLVVAPGDPLALRQAVERLLADPGAREDLAREAWERAAKWTWEDYLSALSALLDEAAGTQAAASRASGPGPSSGTTRASSSPSSVVASPESLREMTFDTPSPPIDTP